MLSPAVKAGVRRAGGGSQHYWSMGWVLLLSVPPDLARWEQEGHGSLLTHLCVRPGAHEDGSVPPVPNDNSDGGV